MVEPPSLVRLGPIGRAIAPPRIKFFLPRRELAQSIDPAALAQYELELVRFYRCMADDLQQGLVAPDIVLIGRDIEIPDQDGVAFGRGVMDRESMHFIEERQFMREFRIFFRVGFVASSGNIEIMQTDRATIDVEGRRYVPRVAFFAEFDPLDRLQR